MTADSNEDAAALAELLRPALHRLHRQLRRNSGGPQNLLLSAITEQPGIGVGELARIEKLRGPTISGHIKSMVAAGLVARQAPDAGDRRRVGLLVTPRGRASLDASRRRKRDWLANRLASLTPTARLAIRRAIAALNEIGR